MAYRPIEDYGLIGDLHTVALVALDGSLDYLCLPDFDSPTVFGALLDSSRGGSFRIGPATEGARLKQLYLPDTNVLLTRFLSPDGVGEVVDFMPVGTMRHTHAVVRRVKGVRGRFRFALRCGPRFDYARIEHRIEQRPGEVFFVPEGREESALRLQTPVATRIESGAASGTGGAGDVVAEFELGPDQTADFVLEAVPPGTATPAAGPRWAERAFRHTCAFWRDWVRSSTYTGRWREEVLRSALAMKLLTSVRHGSIAAAATFGLPELVGGERNWDYRYTWIRDGSLTAAALVGLGFHEEARGFVRWVEQRYRESEEPGRLQIMYGIDGRHELDEEILSYLEGYRGSSPVRVGNGAWNQLQLDIYGEFLMLADLYDERVEPVSHQLWGHLRDSLEWVAANWRLPDEGIWETRGGRQEFLYARLMCWVALDRGLRIAQRRSLPAPLEKWLDVRDEIHTEIHRAFWNDRRKAFVQHRGSFTLDAASLLMPIVGFVSPVDPHWTATLRAIEETLVEDSLVYRYRTGEGASDGLNGTEGTFCMCSYWFIQCLAMAGQTEKAELFFEKMHTYANHLGLYAEEMDGTGRNLGNYPQAFTHLGLVSAAMCLDRALSYEGRGRTAA
ncbi:glycoside hydrolase family 15 protein [Streptomyces sp. TRM 70361]|uniref:glycoside hydrolase family 15 protein n=1 Tax=Streptomyces sp. TRM 70361 TaxID=3116553 RepID=UPI002E7B1BD1|nr:glycoside hydrolase family 15 protein [Streptomyces sp. TRM 70361]MEE1939815.1 glycoside hydrolase family 15 protein [Streptomyces sp. TRM 70361]